MTGAGAGNVIGLIGGLVGIVVFLGAAAVYLRGSKDKGTIATLEASNRALTERVELLEESEQRLTERVAVVEQENLLLRSQRPSAEAIAEILVDLRSHDTKTLEALGRLEARP